MTFGFSRDDAGKFLDASGTCRDLFRPLTEKKVRLRILQTDFFINVFSFLRTVGTGL